MKIYKPGIQPVMFKYICFCLYIACIVPTALAADEIGCGPERNASPHVRGGFSESHARNLILEGDINGAITEYSRLVAEEPDNHSLGSEYAYALALGGIYEASLARLDRIRSMDAGESFADYYASLVFALMGYDQLAAELRTAGEKESAPSWIASRAGELEATYKRHDINAVSGAGESLAMQFRRANRLAASGQHLQSLSLFQDIVTLYPGEYLPYVGYSIALEKAGMIGKSIEAMKSALILISSGNTEQETGDVLERRLSSLEARNAGSGVKTGVAAGTTGPSVDRPNTMVYAGGMLSSNYISMNARFGYFMDKSKYFSLDAGFTNISDVNSVNIGFSVYNRGKIMVLGMGWLISMNSNGAIPYIKISMGPSIMNKKGTASWDIFLDGKMPLKKDMPTTAGISVGRTYYFGKRK